MGGLVRGSAIKKQSKVLKDDRVVVKCDEEALKYFLDILLCRAYLEISMVDTKNHKYLSKIMSID